MNGKRLRFRLTSNYLRQGRGAALMLGRAKDWVDTMRDQAGIPSKNPNSMDF